jgi:hypothetical protein
MFEEYHICPYTGLRSFTEEESLYFKGREENIEQAIEQLQRNKFLMLTGASGDGKSSLVYAGIIPNARAGFLKSHYSQWAVADFRPERSPFRNLCKTVAAQLGIANVHTVESELRHGFSALVELYKNSGRYLDINSREWEQADDKKKAFLKREAGNLLILVDQFEEFFTNPENYHNGAPSTEANLVLNLLLETARLSYDEDLPIYVVFTMRSDFIGQCAAFRGLPEYIGFSQFFVPRLNRTQLQQVIEEPAILSGNRITRRLTERLIHDLTEGGDQLPILQHALNQIWHAAAQGADEMDLLHYAMVGGMPVDELPDDQMVLCQKWFDDLPEEIRACYHEPGLQNVLDTHTNKLYQESARYFEQKTGRPIPDEDVSRVIKTAFTCLTKIDQSRAVRNRMTLQEITDILNEPGIDAATTGLILNIFREPGNTFIRPFITEENESEELKPDDVLDITHESLIRNWRFLDEWAREEYDNFTISLDFEQQLNRWLDSGKSNDFLLSIGPLTFFENWYNRVKPNKYWLARYLPDELEAEKKLEKAKQDLKNSQEFLQLSARRHMITRTVIRFGGIRIAAVLAIILLLSAGTYAAVDYYQKKNEFVLESIKNDTIELANRKNLNLNILIPLITEQMIAGTLTVEEVNAGIESRNQQIKISTAIASQLVIQGRHQPVKEILQSLVIADSLLAMYQEQNLSHQELSEVLKMIYDYSATAGLAYFYHPEERLRALNRSNARRSADWAMFILEHQPEGFADIQNLNAALENSLNHKIFDQDDISGILSILSPFDSETSDWVKENYERDKVLIRSAQPIYGNRFNGLYQELAYLYAASGDAVSALRSVDSLLKYQGAFFQNDYESSIDNATNIAAVFYTYGMYEELTPFVTGYVSRKNTSITDFYNRLVSRVVTDDNLTGHLNYFTGGDQIYSNLNLKFASDDMVTFFFDRYRDEIQKNDNDGARNFGLAVAFKNEGVLKSYRSGIRSDTISDSALQDIFGKAVSHYLQVPDAYLNQMTSVVGLSGVNYISMPRKFMFLYPDYRVPFHPFEPRSFIFFYNSPGFVRYLIDSGQFDLVYKESESLRYFEMWMKEYNGMMRSRDFTMRDEISREMMKEIALVLEERDTSGSLDLNLLYLHIARTSFNEDDTEIGLSTLKKLRTDRILNSFQYGNIGWANSYSLEMVAAAIANLAVHGEYDLVGEITGMFQNEVNRSSVYAFASQLVSLNKQPLETASRLLDSAMVAMNRLDNPTVFQPNRHNVAIAMMKIDPRQYTEEAYRIIRNSNAKTNAISRFALAEAFHHNLYRAVSHTPELVSSSDRAFILYKITEGRNHHLSPSADWGNFKRNELIPTRTFLPYIIEGS